MPEDRSNNDRLIVVNTDLIDPPAVANTMIENRKNSYSTQDVPNGPHCSISITAYNRLEKTRYCVECVLKYTSEIDYELILIDNGSSDGTLDFFKSVDHPKKTVIHITKNIGALIAYQEAIKIYTGKYYITLANDVYVTKNWLTNLLTCYESDPSIGFVMPMSSNVSNLQDAKLQFQSMDEMQAEAVRYNQSNPLLWEERMRLITISSIYTREIFNLVGSMDPGFTHDFGEDDLCLRIRRAGYKLILCKDTFVCHDHSYTMNDADKAAFDARLAHGKEIFRKKHHGLDAWDDVLNFELIPLRNLANFDRPSPRILTLEPRMGTPVLEARNRLREKGIVDVTSHAFTTQAKYYEDLLTVAQDVVCDRMAFLNEHYEAGSYDIVHLCEPVNQYDAPMRLVEKLYKLVAPGGILLFKLRNTDDFSRLMRSAQIGNIQTSELPVTVFRQDMDAHVQSLHPEHVNLTAEPHELGEPDKARIREIFQNARKGFGPGEEIHLFVKNYVYCLKKPLESKGMNHENP